MKHLFVILLALSALSAGQGKQTFRGVITDDTCGATGGHASMRMGPTDAECTRLCVLHHSGAYVLQDGKDVYALSNQRSPEPFAGQEVSVVGTLDAKTKTIQVDSIAAAR